MMTGYNLVNLRELIIQIGEENTKKILSNFSCPLNKDVENFLVNKAIEFSKQKIAATHLVFTSYKGKPVLIGYFTLTNKIFNISSKALSNSLRKRICKFATWNAEMKVYQLSAPLIAQLGKNFTQNYNKLISGDELLKIACDKIDLIQTDLSGKVIYIECEDKEKLMEFYNANGFSLFTKRKLDKHEAEEVDSTYLNQLIKYIH